MIVVMLGPPGSGKGTQSQRLSDLYHVPQVATGDIFRALLKGQSALAEKVRTFVESGSLVPDDVTIEVVRQRLEQSDCRKGFILDGFPRTVGQALSLTGYLTDRNLRIDRVISLDVSDQLVVKRLGGRRTCLDCGSAFHVETHPPKAEGICDRCGARLVQRADDEDKTIRERLAVYHRQTAPLIEHYQSQGLLRTVDGSLAVDQITQVLCQVLDVQ